MHAQRPDVYSLVIWPSMIFAYLLVALRLGNFDEWVAGLFYDAQQNGFPLRHAFWTQSVLHDGARKVFTGFAVALAVVVLASWLPTQLREWRRLLVYLLVSIIVSIGAVNLGKRVTNVDCPWDLSIFGGDRVEYGLLGDKPEMAPVGHCYPGGHSSGGFSLFALYFVGLAVGMRRPRQMLLPPLLLGSILAIDQWMRGAHFPSHDLTTAYICWMVSLLCYKLLLNGESTRPTRVEVACPPERS
ncbi:MAG: phosphatase PAP2 family protein [Gammaproteobacteria bacterium]|nr:phosphatase PAP2 family protein [Gammaproteobacteria bacterium]